MIFGLAIGFTSGLILTNFLWALLFAGLSAWIVIGNRNIQEKRMGTIIQNRLLIRS